MPRLFKAITGVDWPATLADYRGAQAGTLPVKTVHSDPEDEPIAAPYPAIIPSWLANGFKEVND